jgi:hypothetical protein
MLRSVESDSKQGLRGIDDTFTVTDTVVRCVAWTDIEGTTAWALRTKVQLLAIAVLIVPVRREGIFAAFANDRDFWVRLETQRVANQWTHLRSKR